MRTDWADAQADLRLRWAHSHFVGFVMSWLKYPPSKSHSNRINCYWIRHWVDHRELRLHWSLVTRKPVFGVCDEVRTNRPAEPRKHGRAFVVRCLDSIISLDSIAEISRR